MDDEGRTRYLDVDLGDRHVLMPSGHAQVEAEREVVWIPGIRADRLSSIPEYTHQPDRLDSNYERSLATAYDAAYHEDRTYERPDYRGAWGRGRGGTVNNEIGRLDHLDDFEIADDEPDPRGWEVRGRDGIKIGKVEHLIGDTGAMKVRYMTVKLDRGVADDDRRILVPLGHARLATRDKRVEVSALDRNRANELPSYTKDRITRDDETRIRDVFSGGYTGGQEYRHPRYSEERLYGDERRITRSEEEVAVGKRQREAGEVVVEKNVETEHVRKPVKTRHEEVEIERRPASRTAGRGEVREEELRVPIREEEVVVEKRPRVKEEIVVRKRDREETEVVDEEVRKERVDVKKDSSRGTRGKRGE